MSQKNDLKNFLQLAFGIDINNLIEGSEIDVSLHDKKVSSFNHEKNVKEFNRVNRIIRKEDSIKYILNDKVECSKEHRFYVKVDLDKEGTYMEVQDISKLKNFFVFDGENYTKGILNKTKEKLRVYDLEVDKVHNFFTGGYLSHNSYGNPFVEVGGEAIKYYTALKIELTKSVDKDKDSKEVFGLKVKANITKSKVGIPYGNAEYYIDFGKGIVRWKEVMDIAVDKEIITKEGNTYSFEGNKLGVGLGQLEECLQDNPELLEKLEIKVLDLLNNKIETKDEDIVEEIASESTITEVTD